MIPMMYQKNFAKKEMNRKNKQSNLIINKKELANKKQGYKV